MNESGMQTVCPDQKKIPSQFRHTTNRVLVQGGELLTYERMQKGSAKTADHYGACQLLVSLNNAIWACFPWAIEFIPESDLTK